MKLSSLLQVLLILTFFLLSKKSLAQNAAISVTLAIHSEDSYHPTTPLFESATAKDTYLAFRKAILDFAILMHQQNIPWGFQSDWNFLNGAILYGVNNPNEDDRNQCTYQSTQKGANS